MSWTREEWEKIDAAATRWAAAKLLAQRKVVDDAAHDKAVKPDGKD